MRNDPSPTPTTIHPKAEALSSGLSTFPSEDWETENESAAAERRALELSVLERLAKSEGKAVPPGDDPWETYGFDRLNRERSKRKIVGAPARKWTALVKESLFDQPEKSLNAFLDVFGFVPGELFTKIGFFKHMNLQKAAEIVDIFRKRESVFEKAFRSGDASAKRKLSETKAARSHFVRALFLRKTLNSGEKILAVAETAKLTGNGKKSVSLDTNGIKIELFREGKSVNSHVPFGKVDEEFLRSLLVGEWITEDEFLEIRRRSCVDGGKIEKSLETEDFQISRLIRKFLDEGLGSTDSQSGNGVPEFLSGGRELRRKWAAGRFLEYPEVFAKFVLSGSIVPDGVLDEAAGSPIAAIGKSERLHRFFRFAEAITMGISNARLFDDETLFQTFSLARTANWIYEERMKTLQDPRQYSTYRAIARFMESGVPKNDLREGFVLYRARERSLRQSQSFLSVSYGNDSPKRMLFSDGKHLPATLEKNLRDIQEIDHETFVRTETVLRSVAVFRRDYTKIAIASKTGGMSEENGGSDGIFGRISLFITDFFPTETDRVDLLLSKTRQAFDETGTENRKDAAAGLFSELKDLFDRLPELLEGPTEIPKRGTVSGLRARTARFDEIFVASAKKRNFPDYAYGEAISSCGRDVFLVEISDDSSSKRGIGTNAYHLASRAMEKLGVDPCRPLIVVSGGCKALDGEGKNQIDTVVRAIMKLAGKTNANLSIPCTQSGIGLALAEKYLDYLDLSVGRSEGTKFKTFQIAPGKSVLYPGMLESFVPKDELYAINPVDTVLISDCEAGWSFGDADIRGAGYFEFVRWLETIYERLDPDKNRIHVVGNGGLFTIVEVNASLVSGAKTVFIRDAGRFSGAASVFVENFKLLARILSILSLSDDSIRPNSDAVAATESVLRENMGEADFREWIEKDWGAGPPGEKNALYREHFFRFLYLLGSAVKKPTALGAKELENL